MGAQQPNIFVIVGPGGVGKGTVVGRLVARDPQLWLSRSWTTRDQRPGESAEAYKFVSRYAFLDHLANGGFVEHAEFLGNLYGTPNPTAPSGCDVVLEIDVQGAAQIVAKFPEACVIFIDAPSAQEMERRLVGRGDPAPRVRERLAHASHEADAARPLVSHWVVNHTVDDTVAEIEAIIRGRRGL